MVPIFRTNRRSILLKAVVFLIAAGLISYASWGFWQRHQATSNPNPVIPADIVTNSVSQPDETLPYCDNSYQVAPESPRKIVIPSIGVDGCIQKVGVDQHNAIAVPTNIHLAGWYAKSVLPGEIGLSIIDGHVLGRYNDAIFARLKDLKINDTIRIESGDSSQKEFTVLSVDSYAVEETMEQAYQPFDGDRRLVLITCDGVFDPADDSYDRRIVVRATLSN
jgi:sortase (surface protein transpeptidase)